MSLLKKLHSLCLEHNISVAVAESCTSGRIASKLSSLPKSSKYFKGGIIAYQNEIKTNVLGVPESLIDKRTEVSSEVAEQMVINTLLNFDSDYALATTGYAGPSGGSEKNPIGTVYIAIGHHLKVIATRFVFSGDRQSVIKQATQESLSLLYSEIKKTK